MDKYVAKPTAISAITGLMKLVHAWQLFIPKITCAVFLTADCDNVTEWTFQGEVVPMNRFLLILSKTGW